MKIKKKREKMRIEQITNKKDRKKNSILYIINF